MSTPAIQWYPGHIAKAQQHLQQQLQRVDVVLEVLDARIPSSSRHPDLDSWIQGKPRVVVLNRADMIPVNLVKAWQHWYAAQDMALYPTNGQSGQGVDRVKQAALQLGSSVNQRRRQRGMQPRPIRAVVVGFPNVGKSALLNRLIGRRVAESAARPGVTRQLQWVRLGAELDLLDAPGIIPPALPDQTAAIKLAICDDIGQAAYTAELVAAAFFDLIAEVQPQALPTLQQRYQLQVWAPGSILVDLLAEQRFHHQTERAAQQILNDYRKGLLGPLALEHPPQEA
jgi:ribosome biogenesis GTPase A